MNKFDKSLEMGSRYLARRTSRRSFLTKLGKLLVGVSVIPLLPVSRLSLTSVSLAAENDPGDRQDCEYWRYCAIDGFLCTCCGGTISSCPPGTTLSPIAWIGTCFNPGDGLNYIISYNDCCGQSSCGQCDCNRNDRDRPIYMPFQANDINWCTGSSADVLYNCTVAAVVGVDE